VVRNVHELKNGASVLELAEEWDEQEEVIGWTKPAVLKMTHKNPCTIEYLQNEPQKIMKAGSCRLFSI